MICDRRIKSPGVSPVFKDFCNEMLSGLTFNYYYVQILQIVIMLMTEVI